MFRDNFAQFDADDNIVAGGPRLLSAAAYRQHILPPLAAR